MEIVRFSVDRRVVAAAVTVLIEAMLVLVLVMHTGDSTSPARADEIKTFAIAQKRPLPPRPLVKPIPKPNKAPRREGAASPPNLRAKATEIVAVAPIIPPPVPPLILAATIPDVGTAATSGSSAVKGPGTGSGGVGNGTGSGAGGDGDGGGGGGGDGIAPRHRKGALKDSDYPLGVGEAGVGGTVSVLYLVGVDGRVSDCKVMRSSGNADLDSVTCRLITERFRFDPSRDGRGRPVPAYIRENHSWSVEDEPGERR